MSLSVTPTHLLNTARNGGLITSLGCLFHSVITLWVKKLCLLPDLNFPWYNLKPFSLVLSYAEYKHKKFKLIRQVFQSNSSCQIPSHSLLPLFLTYREITSCVEINLMITDWKNTLWSDFLLHQWVVTVRNRVRCVYHCPWCYKHAFHLMNF